MRDHWHIVYLTESLTDVLKLIEQAGLSIRYPTWHRHYPGVESEAVGYFDQGRGAIAHCQFGRLVYEESLFLANLRRAVAKEARTQLIIVTGEQGNPTPAFDAWLNHIRSHVTVTHPCSTCTGSAISASGR